MSNTVAFLSPKGGTGKSTLTLSVARALALLGHRVEVIDSDTQGTARYWAELTALDAGFTVRSAHSDAELQSAVSLSKAQFVLIDGSAKANTMLLSAVRAADLVLLPVTPGGPDAWASMTLVDTVRAHQSAHDGKPLLAAVLNRAKRSTRLYRDLIRYLDDEGIDRASGSIGDRTAIASAIAEGSTCFDATPTDPKATAEIDYLARQIVEVFS